MKKTSNPSMVNGLFTMNRYAGTMSWTGLQIRIERTLFIAIQAMIALLCLSFAQPAFAQSTTTYVVTNDGTINGSTPCGNPLVRNFNVTDSFTVADVDLGFFATHTWRGDIRVTLEAPNGGPSVQLVTGETNNTNGDNINVLLDDDFGTEVNSTNITSDHSTTAPPPFENNRSPNNALSAFNGVASLGTWRMEICDLFTGQDDGTFRHAELYLTSQPTNIADLSLTKILIGSPPLQNGSVTWRLIATNDSSSAVSADGVVVQESFPAGFTLTSTSGDGSFNTGNGQWSVGTLDPGESAILTIVGTVSSSAGTTLTNNAEIIASSVADPDSTPNNGVTSEDDYASASITVQSSRTPGIPPVLSCPAGFSVFDWDTISGWTNGSTDNTYAFASFGNIRFELSNDGTFLNSANFGGQTPTVFDYYSGGISPSEDSLHMLANQANQSGEVTIVITLPRSFTGVQFSIFDVDFGNNQFADRVQVTGSNGGSSVTPTLTNGNVNYVSGNTVIGDGSSGNNDPFGNVVVTFTQSVDTITITYGNHTTAPNNPGQQGISIHDINVCNPFTNLNVSKISSIISDPVNGNSNPKAIPGATVEYLITVTNIGSEATDAGSVVVWDDGPADAKMCLIARSGGPVIFNDPSTNSGLTYDYGGAGSVTGDLAVTTDDLEFSNNGGSSFTYVPSDDGEGCDTAITDFRVNPGGAFDAGGNFTLTVRYIIE